MDKAAKRVFEHHFQGELSFIFAVLFLIMDYEETIAFLMRQLPMFSRKGKSALKPGLENILALCNALGHPQDTFPSIHIAGTNGKGSVCHLLAAALQAHGLQVGLYTSPHLVDFRERFRINGQLISKQKVVVFVAANQSLIERLKPSYFELSVALAFHVFAEEKVDVAIIETGLGGRLDSTNIIHPELSIITQIGYDHMDVLGDTLAEIAAEKAGIIKNHVPVVVGESHPETKNVFITKAQSCHAEICFADSIWEMTPLLAENGLQQYRAFCKTDNKKYLFQTDLTGVYQKSNLATAAMAIQTLQKAGWRLDLTTSLQSFASVKACTGLHGRWEILQQRPKIILEVAHNKGGLYYLIKNIAKERTAISGKLRIIVGFVKDKDVDGALSQLPKDGLYFFTQANVMRAMAADVLFEKAEKAGLSGKAFPVIEEAVVAALEDCQDNDILLVTGSFFIVGEIMPILQSRLSQQRGAVSRDGAEGSN